MAGPKPKPVAQRFWGKVRKTDSCWEWTGAISDNGYGVIGVGNRKNGYAHRISYEMAFGEVPSGICVCHRCDNPRCVRPAHLFLGTQEDNIRDMIRKGRRGSYDRHGARNPRATLTMAQIVEVRRLRLSGETLSSIASRFGIGTSQVHRITTNQSWRESSQ